MGTTPKQQQRHEQSGHPKGSRKPNVGRSFDIQATDDDARLLCSIGFLELWHRYPHNGPTKPGKSKERTRVTKLVLGVWIVWLFLGFIWLFATGSFVVLGSSAILVLYPVKKVMDYYYLEAQPGKRRGPKPKA